MKDAKNLTLEGVGCDAMIYGWGIPFHLFAYKTESMVKTLKPEIFR